MFDKKFIHHVQALRAIKPSAEWKSRTKDVLLSQIRSQGSQQIAVPFAQRAFVYCTESARIAYHTTFGVVFARPAYLAAALSVVIVIGSGVVFVAERSLPGDPLYAVKQTKEDMSIALTAPQDRAEAELERVTRRLEELRALQSAPLSDSEKDKQMETVVDTLSRNLSTARESLETITEPGKAISVANAIKEKTATTRQELGSLKVSEQVEQKFTDAQNTARTADQKALEVIVDKGSGAGLTDAAIANQLTQEAQILAGRLNTLEMKVTIAVVSQESDRDELLKKKDEARASLAIVTEQIEKKDFKLALEKIGEAKEIVSAIEQKLKDTAQGSAPADGKRNK